MLYSRVRSERNQSNSGTGTEGGGGGGGSSSTRSASGPNSGTSSAPIGISSASLGVPSSSQLGAGTSGGGGGNVSGSTSASANVGGSGSGGGVGGGSGSGSSAAVVDRDSFSRWRDRQYYGPRRWFTSREETCWEKESPDMKKKDASSGLPLWISDDLELWPERDTTLRFTQIAALHSEFIAVSTKGELHQWRWSDMEPYRHHENANIFHPKTNILNLTYEKIIHISATSIRCTVATEQNRVATWMDELLGYAGNKLEHAATCFTEFAVEKIVALYTCTQYTVARTDAGGLYWWGVIPFDQRKRLWDKHKAKAKKPIRSSNTNSQEVLVGSQVCMKKSPMYQPGAIGFTISNGIPRVGQLLNAAWDISNSCRFKLITIPPLPGACNANAAGGGSGGGTSSSSTTGTGSGGTTTGGSNTTPGSGPSTLTSNDLKDLLKSSTATPMANNAGGSTVIPPPTTSSKSNGGNNKETADRLDMPPPPSPASSTCSDTGSITSNKRPKRAAPKEDVKKDEESWFLP